MIKLLKLYSVPEIFEPIEFSDGINLILGEKVEKEKIKTRKDRKTNGVGKSVCVEFINFALLKKEGDSRVMKIPFDKIPLDLKIKLDLLINKNQITIERSYHEPEKPVIKTENSIIPFSKIDDALVYLRDLVLEEKKDDQWQPSFRELISPLIRDEDSEFKNIIDCFDVTKKIPTDDLIGIHLYFFNIDALPVKKIKESLIGIINNKKTKSYIKNRLTDSGRKKISDIKSELNALEREIDRAEGALNKFESESLLLVNRDQLLILDNEIETLRTRRAAICSELKKIESIPKPEVVDASDIEVIYNKFKDGLGSIISQSFEQVLNFKQKIERYQKMLIDEKAVILRKEENEVLERLRELDEKRGKILKQLDNKGILRDFKNSFSVYSHKKEELSKNISNLEEYEIAEREIRSLELKKDNLFAELDAQLFKIQKQIRDFEQTLVSMHEYIMGTAEASFDIKTVNKTSSKKIIDIELRIEDDGGHSVNRTKVFMYDIALMLNHFTSKKHPKFLIHDNIFDVDQDTLVQSLNYLAEQEKRGFEFQYILTLNRDKIETEERQEQINLKIDDHKKASFDRRNTFLKFRYKEV